MNRFSDYMVAHFGAEKSVGTARVKIQIPLLFCHLLEKREKKKKETPQKGLETMQRGLEE